MTGTRAGIRMKAGTPKAAIVSKNDKIKPDRIAGIASGSVIVRVIRNMPAPSVRPAFSYSLGACSSAAETSVNG